MTVMQYCTCRIVISFQGNYILLPLDDTCKIIASKCSSVKGEKKTANVVASMYRALQYENAPFISYSQVF